MENENVAASLIEEALADLPRLLLNDSDVSWQTRYVTYQNPTFFQMACRWKYSLRLVLHVFLRPQEESSSSQRQDFNSHYHPWKHAVKVLDGCYRMRIGANDHFSPEAFSRPVCTVDVGKGAVFSMLDPTGWHSITPLTDTVVAIMLTDKPWEFMMSHVPRCPSSTREMSAEEIHHMKQIFCNSLGMAQEEDDEAGTELHPKQRQQLGQIPVPQVR
jgi:hypothetical protein